MTNNDQSNQSNNTKPQLNTTPIKADILRETFSYNPNANTTNDSSKKD